MLSRSPPALPWLYFWILFFIVFLVFSILSFFCDFLFVIFLDFCNFENFFGFLTDSYFRVLGLKGGPVSPPLPVHPQIHSLDDFHHLCGYSRHIHLMDLRRRWLRLRRLIHLRLLMLRVNTWRLLVPRARSRSSS